MSDMREDQNDQRRNKSLFCPGTENRLCGTWGPSAFKGYTLFLCKEHKTELFDLAPDRKLAFLEEMSLVAEAAAKAFGAEKMNYELLGNGDTHLHWHLFPRVSGDLGDFGNQGKGPVWWYPMEQMYADENRPTAEELTELKSKLAEELEKLI